MFNVTQRALCGMVVRGGMKADVCTLCYVDMFDIAQLLSADDRVETCYRKHVMKMVKTRSGV